MLWCVLLMSMLMAFNLILLGVYLNKLPNNTAVIPSCCKPDSSESHFSFPSSSCQVGMTPFSSLPILPPFLPPASLSGRLQLPWCTMPKVYVTGPLFLSPVCCLQPGLCLRELAYDELGALPFLFYFVRVFRL